MKKTYGQLERGQFKVDSAVLIKEGRAKNDAPIFFGRVPGQSGDKKILFHTRYFRPPYAIPGDVLANEIGVRYKVRVGMSVCAVCQMGFQGPRAVRWCTWGEMNTALMRASDLQVEANRTRLHDQCSIAERRVRLNECERLLKLTACGIRILPPPRSREARRVMVMTS